MSTDNEARLRGEAAQPVPVAGDAMCVRCGDKPEGADSLNLTLSGLVTYGRVAANPAQGASRWHLMDLVRQMVPHLEAALSTQPAPSEQVAETDERMASMMEHGMAAWSVTPATKPEQLAASVPCAFRSLLAEARRQYRDSDAAGDVLAWLDERVLDVDHAASVAVPEGWRLVPEMASAEMLDAAIDAFLGFSGEDEVDEVWGAMLAAVENKHEA